MPWRYRGCRLGAGHRCVPGLWPLEVSHALGCSGPRAVGPSASPGLGHSTPSMLGDPPASCPSLPRTPAHPPPGALDNGFLWGPCCRNQGDSLDQSPHHSQPPQRHRSWAARCQLRPDTCTPHLLPVTSAVYSLLPPLSDAPSVDLLTCHPLGQPFPDLRDPLPCLPNSVTF